MSTVTLARNLSGIIPPQMFLDIVRINPQLFAMLDTLVDTAEMYKNSSTLLNPNIRFLGAGKGDIEIYDCKGGTSRPGKRARFEGDQATGNEDVDKAYAFTEAVRKYYLDVHGRNSIDANGMKMISSVNYGRGYNNAFWDGSQMTYGKGDGQIFASFVIPDVCGHEITHGVTEYVSKVQYYGQSGALNEHFSDVFGKLIEAYMKGQSVDAIDWVLGRGIFMPGINGQGIRHMRYPGTAYDDSRIGKDRQPDRMSNYVKTSADNGGVHYNSGIPNRAFAEFAIACGGYAWDKAGKIWYAARANSGSRPSFAFFAHQTLAACKTLYPAELKKLEQAWALVEITPSSAQTNDTLTPLLAS